MHQSEPRVSVIMNFLNPQPYFEEAIQSVLTQIYPHWELLLVDDGSGDGSSGVALRYAADFPDRIRYLEHEGHENRGMSASRNLGISKAAGEYVTFLDADDAWLPDFLQWQVETLDAQPGAAMSYGPLLYWHSWTGDPADADRDIIRRPWFAPGTLVRPPALLPVILEKRNGTPSGYLIRHEVVRAVGGFEDSFRDLFEDQVFCAKVALSEAVYIAERWGYKYRQHAASACGRSRRTGYVGQARKKFLLWLIGYLRAHGTRKFSAYLYVGRSYLSLMIRQRFPAITTLERTVGRNVRRARRAARRLLPA